MMTQDVLQIHFAGRPLAIEWRVFEAMAITGDLAVFEAARAESRARKRSTVAKGTAVLPIHGPLTKRSDPIAELFGWSSTDRTGEEFDRLVNDDSVDSILLDLDSPGGEVFGVQELSDKIYRARGKKRVEAHINPEAGSAALWIATAADKVSITPSGMAGSIGVFMQHNDLSEANRKAGIHVTYVASPPAKIEGNPNQPLSREARAHFQRQVDRIYARFVGDVARNRGRTPAYVQQHFGRGRMLMAAAALSVGLVDAIEPVEASLARLSSGGYSVRSADRRRMLNRLRYLGEL